MKKNAMLKIAAILLVAVLLTTCAISTTFAKYVTNPDAPDAETARVAKWGLAIEYGDGEYFATDYFIGTKNVVDSSNDDKVLAPGTRNDAVASVNLTGTPEVAFKLSATANVNLTGWTVDLDGEGGSDAEEYCPLIVLVGTTEYKMDNTNTTIELLETAIEEAIVTALLGTDYEENTADGNDDLLTASKEYAAKTNVGEQDLSISWYWPASVNDAKDTYLGDVAADDVDAAAKITISYSLSAEQVVDTVTNNSGVLNGGADPVSGS